MAPGGRQVGGSSGEDDKDAKHVLDEFGQQVYDEIVKKEVDGTGASGDAKKYIEELKACVSFATFSGVERAYTTDPCELIKDKGHKILAARGHPCKKDGTGKEEVKRFSDKEGAQCDNRKIKDSNVKEGACAPFRRLSLCNRNLEKIPTSTTKHDLLVDVCMAAKYEGESIKTHYPQYDAEYSSGSGHTTCTALARSFADIGDIVRGKDLYSGNTKEKKKRDELETNLKTIFRDIYNELTTTNGVKSRYNGDEDNNFFKLREDWWTANRETVWKAMTCEAPEHASYFRVTCNDNGIFSQANDKCRCQKKDGKSETDQVPTYFDYVPQYLRWFEEWAEDFCRKKKKKVENLQKQCRGKDNSSDDRYCSRNGCDCTKTVRAKGKLRYGNRCTDCLYACHRYENWIEKQKEQFDKQVKKYGTEISGGGASGSGSSRQRRSAHGGSDHKGYEKIFYEKLKSEYRTVDAFLEKLSKENVCTQITDEKEGKIDFKNVKSSGASHSGTNDIKNGTFYRSKYCQPCPYCGMKRKNDGTIVKKSETDNCKSGNLYKPKKDAPHTTINFLYSGDEPTEIGKKLNEFCTKTQNGSVVGGPAGAGAVNAVGGSSSQELYQDWQCYEGKDVEKVENKDEEKDEDDDQDYENVKNAGGLCILKNQKKNKEGGNTSEKEPDEIQKTFNPFFYYWVAHMLKDSIYWRTKKLDKCINNNTNGNRCRNGCIKNCKCFLQWVEQKKNEWTNIKQHFYKQEDIVKVGPFKFTHDGVLKQVLELEFSKENSKEDAENNVSAEEIDLINKILDEEKQKSEAAGGGVGGENKTTIDKLLDHEKKIAEKCKETHNEDQCKPKPPPRESAGRSHSETGPQSPAGPQPPAPGDNGHHSEDSEEEEEDEDDEDGAEPVEDEETADTTVERPKEGSPSPPTQNDVNVCETVDKLFKDGTTLTNACPTKYVNGREKFPNWKCISGATTSDKGAICVPPRRRKLYVTPLTKWAKSDEATEAESQETSGTSSQSGEKLREAFIQSAAVETFFLWHKYKAENTKTQSGGVGGLLPINGRTHPETLPPLPNIDGAPVPNGETLEPNDPNNIYSGKIPPSFLRQMFYTLGDYRDILVRGGDTKDANNIILNASGSTEQEKQKMQEIQKKIKQTLESGSTEASVPNPQPPGQQQQNSSLTRETWWNEHAKHIWHGMICALTYDTDSGDKDTPQVDDKVKKELFGKDGASNEPIKYQYTNVKLDENSGTQPRTGSSLSGVDSTINNPKLSDFVLRPPYFRWLEEWGQNFCKERAKRLEEIKDNCTEDGRYGNKNCSGDGFDCDEMPPKKEDIFKPLNCHSCAKHCRWYKKWIKRKKIEFDKQKDRYQTENTNYDDSTYDKVFCGTLNTYSKAGDFLERLKFGPCKNNNDESGQGKKGGDILNFTKPEETFRPAKNCKPCSVIGVECKNCNSSGGGTQVKCNRGKISADDIPSLGNSTVIDMLVSDNSGNELKNGLSECKDKGIFKGIRKDEWKCGKVCGVDICTLEKNNNGTVVHEHITVKELLKRWLETFFEDYNRIQKKLNLCIENGKGCKCIKDCVDKWIEKKTTEWNNINSTYQEINKNKNDDAGNNLSTFLQQAPFKNEVDKAIKPCGTLQQFEKSKQCNATASSESGKHGTQKDIVECLFQKLEEKATSCPGKTSDSPEEKCGEDPTTLDDEEPLEEDEQNPVGKQEPSFCPPQPKETKKEEEDTCEEAVDPGGAKKAEEESGIPPAAEPEADKGPEQADTEKKVPPKPAPARPKDKRRPKRQPQNPWEHPIVIPSLATSTLMWTVGIGFAAFTYFFLKKKTKSSVGNLFQILQIPKGDYDIPTLKSSNRYIPYASDRYKGKTYIYMEGDSGDEKYTFMSDTSDITSSESEYEELDINDIYVPGSPKYKTLIEVVLEPSKRDTQNDIHNDIPSDIPNSDTPPPITDDEWNKLKKDFISNMLQNTQNTEPNILRDNVDNNTHPTTSRHNVEEKPFIMSIHDRNLYIGEEYNYDMFNSGNNPINISDSTNSMDSLTSNNHGPYNDKNDLYSGIDLINDALSGNHIDIYDEMLKRKENELFGTQHHPKNITSNRVVTQTSSDDPLHNQLNLFHQWLDRHRDMCEKWKNNHERLPKLKELWENETHSGDINSGIPSGNHVLNTDVSIQIDMDNLKPKNEFTNMDTNPDKSTMDTILDDLEKYNEPYYYDFYKDDIYYDVNDDKASEDHINMDHNKMDNNNSDVPTNVQIEMNVINNQELLQNEYPISHM
ncbi:erythrocyte membrane protein 1 [Plasmodium falciparum RAJ116]|uniref:Erythrocyte membrane protein 1 n=1 Tax=Plasmodium falciparum RAJ116 TaxID=580058 RepID=A0A0L0CS08_PLAFA|nr:erythrocyte membrane protein 1 [Plasmodium falciparum RAJ116]